MRTTLGNRYLASLCGARLAVAGVDALRAARTPDRTVRSFLEVLAGRHLVQFGATVARPSRRVVAGGATVDTLHSLSMVGLASASPTHRRGALTDAAIAGGLAAAGAVISIRWNSLA